MYRNILVPLDGSDFALSALPLALAIAERNEGSSLQLATVVSTLPPFVFKTEDEGAVKGWFEEERERAVEYLEKVKNRIADAGVPVHLRSLTGGAVRSLDEEIRRLDVDLVVMTTHGRGPFERLWLGSVAEGLVRHAPCPILLQRPSEGDEPALESRPSFQRILVPLDGSDVSEAMLLEAVSLAKMFGASLSLVSVSPGQVRFGSPYIPHAAEEVRDREEGMQEIHDYLEGHAARLREAGLDVSVAVVADQDPAEGILSSQAELGADAIAMSTHGRGGVARMVLGSVADKVIRAADVPVLIHRHSEEEEEA